MGKIVILDENTANKIAAGEVIEKPASVIKELVENSIDAGAGSITVEIKNGGVSYIKVTDNGSGIDEDDVEIAFERHATSKIRTSDDLDSISTMGFRGEALASIAAVSKVELTTRVQKNAHGTYIMVQGGVVKDVRQAGCPVGTTFIIKDLFYNTPARYKFLKKDSTEAGYVSDTISRISLGNPQISFRLLSNNTTILHTPGNNDLKSTIFSIYGKDIAKEVMEVNYSDNKLKITGFAGKPEIARSNRNYQSIYINRRYIKSKVITSAIDEAYNTFLLKNKFAFIVLNIEINPLLVDVNVHPSKMEVRFSEEQDVFRSVYHAVTNALLDKPLIKSVQLDDREKDVFKLKENEYVKTDYVQQKLNPFGVGRNLKEHNKYYEKNVPFEDADEKVINTGVFEKHIDIKQLNIDIPQAKEALTPVIEPDISNSGPKIIEAAVENELPSAKIIGQAFSTYIILQLNEELLLIDQHAAHERIMYEQLKTKYSDNESLSQMLITPEAIQLTHQELKLLEDRREFFNKLGYIYEDFGNNSIILRAIPNIFDGNPVKELFLDILDYMSSSIKSNPAVIADDTLYTIACKAAVKANKKLDDLEIESILSQLAGIDNPYTCPHGRPTIIRITKYELEKKFKRIV